jgi:hypothetical protein
MILKGFWVLSARGTGNKSLILKAFFLCNVQTAENKGFLLARFLSQVHT